MSDKERLPRRDWVLLPAIGLATIFLMAAIPELIARNVFYKQEADACLAPDPVLGHRALPNCDSRYKPAEAPWIANHYNECGYRTNESCGPKPDGTFRIALVGASTSLGYLVAYPESFAVRVGKSLSERCGRAVEGQNLGGLDYQWGRVEARMDEAIGLKPDLVLMVLTPYDLLQPTHQDTAAAPPKSLRVRIQDTVRSWIQGSGSWGAILHYRARLPDVYLKAYLREPDRSGYMRQPFSPAWQARIDDTDHLLGSLAGKAGAAKVPLTLIYVPFMVQAVLEQHASSYPDTSPLALDDALGRIAARYGISYVDMEAALQHVRDLSPLFYPVDDHITGAGSAILARQLDHQILAAHYPGLPGCSYANADAAAE